ncbi:hypothetical protein PROFUN_14544 [Planoprotostelium fungivorum]|uniref:Uncharacterized protein n=1 Tax=Planoprotostelium fungivorum TaxID=1890364 RepID=A0A2P6MZL0_9EUKA|nr:hypothetical protein PROFUN_14544 [Planoprotostelium fungivorum]
MLGYNGVISKRAQPQECWRYRNQQAASVHLLGCPLFVTMCGNDAKNGISRPIASKNPEVLYDHLKAHRFEIVSSTTIEELKRLIALTVIDAQNEEPAPIDVQTNANERTGSINIVRPSVAAKIQLAKFFHFKLLVIRFCMEFGLDEFFEIHLQSEPPDEVVMKFQKELVLWSPEQFLSQYQTTVQSTEKS